MIDEFVWTGHLARRLEEREVSKEEVEENISTSDELREANEENSADWKLSWTRGDGYRVIAFYDNPAWGDERMARVVTVEIKELLRR
jgi:murein L,D-transpeptidase YafK